MIRRDVLARSIVLCCLVSCKPRLNSSQSSPTIYHGTPATNSQDDENATVMLDVIDVGSCSGVAIDDRVVLSAAHCLAGETRVFWDVKPDKKTSPHRQVVKILTKLEDPDPSKVVAGDVGLFVLDTPLPSSVVRAKLMSPDNNVTSQSKLRIVGYGETESGQWGEKFTLDVAPYTQSDEFLSFRARQKIKGACRGDSGGPYFMRGTVTVVALVAGGIVCGLDTMATYLKPNLKWICEQASPYWTQRGPLEEFCKSVLTPSIESSASEP